MMQGAANLVRLHPLGSGREISHLSVRSLQISQPLNPETTLILGGKPRSTGTGGCSVCLRKEDHLAHLTHEDDSLYRDHEGCALVRYQRVLVMCHGVRRHQVPRRGGRGSVVSHLQRGARGASAGPAL
ncbi:hypothetical protein Q8A67_016256 [Cirrhinus molitorella]|uniref:Uncharacterized protein n=1 Tax=Cirrhinus molitorella TaxID=172907 RepID=A0AA88PG99_9TELE|nr:hypothetical protein Q8A67_016256 [Cirrhinus molitorella]